MSSDARPASIEPCVAPATRCGLLFIVSAPSGAGKTTLVERLVEQVPRLRMSRSYTSRAARQGEANGVDYNFVERRHFEQMIAAGEFLEWAEVFGNLYGTCAADTERMLAAGDDVVLVIDVQGARKVRSLGLVATTVFVMPPSADFRAFLRDKLEAFSAAALLPLFFAFTGLRTQIGLLNDWQSWALCGVIILVAIAGKLGGSMLMSRWTGMNWTQSFSIGVLMNTRGLVELVVLNIGYDLGILSGRIFAMMVLMALVTTFMTGPLLSLVNIRAKGTT